MCDSRRPENGADSYRSPWDDSTPAEEQASEMELLMHKQHAEAQDRCFVCETDGPAR